MLHENSCLMHVVAPNIGGIIIYGYHYLIVLQVTAQKFCSPGCITQLAHRCIWQSLKQLKSDELLELF